MNRRMFFATVFAVGTVQLIRRDLKAERDARLRKILRDFQKNMNELARQMSEFPRVQAEQFREHMERVRIDCDELNFCQAVERKLERK
ncbi:MAG: hypothetical protein L0211_24825 [Planctomycetaceae bacterium]|nr:hypothetical protein [Planctomycetaceae bacterium]